MKTGQKLYKRVTSALAAGVLAAGLLGSAVALPAVAGESELYQARLDGADEVPAVATTAHGNLTLKIAKSEESARFVLVVNNIQNVVAAHLHLAPEGVNGPVVVTLFNGSLAGKVGGVLASGTITAADLVGPLTGMDIEDLEQAMEDGDIYVNVHTTQHPGGEMRGQVFETGHD